MSARLIDCEDSAVWKPRPVAGIMVDWQIKVFTALAPSPFCLCWSVKVRSVTLSVQAARWSLNKEREPLCSTSFFCTCIDIIHEDKCVCVCVFSRHLPSAQTDVKVVKVLGAFGGETRSNHQCSYWANEAKVKGQRDVALRVGEETIAVTWVALLVKKTHILLWIT